MYSHNWKELIYSVVPFQIERLPPPYMGSTCVETNPKKNVSFANPLQHFDHYSYSACKLNCLIEFINDTCNCKIFWHNGKYNSFMKVQRVQCLFTIGIKHQTPMLTIKVNIAYSYKEQAQDIILLKCSRSLSFNTAYRGLLEYSQLFTSFYKMANFAIKELFWCFYIYIIYLFR